MRAILLGVAVLAFVQSGCISAPTGETGPNRAGIAAVESARPKSCYGGPVYVPC